MPIDETLNDIAWKKVFDGTNALASILQNGFVELSADQLGLHGGREPRLMAKLDSSAERPNVFRDNALNILPLSRGTYIVFKDPENICYFPLATNDPPNDTINFKAAASLNKFQTLPRGLCTGESAAVELAYISGLLASFCNVEQLTLTRRGRFASSEFTLHLPNSNQKKKVARAQVEVDSIYESSDRVVLIEAKMGFRDDFNVRQLYYPYMWLLSQTTKDIVSILLCYSNGKFQLTEFRLNSKFGQLNILRHHQFVIDEGPRVGLDVDQILKSLPQAIESDSAPFPQANDLDKVVDVVRAVEQGNFKTEELCDSFGFVPRQADYYRNAARYLDLIDGDAVTELGVRLLSQNFRDNRNELLFRCLAARPIFRLCIQILSDRDFDVNRITVTEIEGVVSSVRSDLSSDTQRRRASTVRQWLKWLTENCEFK